MTTSSLILKALVCLAMAAVLERSSQNTFLSVALLAIKASPSRFWARVTMCFAASSSSAWLLATISASNTILGRVFLAALVA